jgi:hypothetical protein
LIYHFLQMLGLPTLYLLLVDFWGDGIPVRNRPDPLDLPGGSAGRNAGE